jgi:glucan phosphoethanolaminetransferase (alkaline phosphatase superfamily)
LTTARRLGAAAFVVLVATCLIDHGELLRTAQFQLTRQDTGRPILNAGVYVAAYLAVVLAIAVGLCHRRGVRVATIALTLLAACIQGAVTAVNGVGFTHHEASLLLTETDFLGAALGFFLPSYAFAASATLLGGAAAVWLALRVGPRLRSWLWLGVPLAAALAAHQIVDQTFGKVYQFPPPVRVALLTAWAWQHRLPVYAEREAPYFTPTAPALADHIILVVDESISGHWLAVNGAPVATTPWLSSRPEGVFNYGIASAISNLSSSSNLVLQTGLRPLDLPDRNLQALRGPNVFAYLTAAGFHTALIDAQTYSDAPPNLMTGFDLRRIDTVLRLRETEAGIPEYAVDFAALPRIRRLVEDHPKTFTYLIKTGAHLPYDDKSPPDERPFSSSGESGVRGIRHAYWNAVRWTTDHFLHELTRELEGTGKEVLVVYTSDHGQWLADEKTTGRKISPHATVLDPPSEQASVPLLLFGVGSRTRAALAERFSPRLFDGASAYEIFPTLLQAAGYAAADTHERYPPSLFEGEAERPRRTFVSGNIFGTNGGAYVLNRGFGDDCFVNPFDVDSVRVSTP